MLLHHALQQSVNDMPENLALTTTDGQQISYLAFSDLVASCIASLQAFELKAGERVGIYLPKHVLSAIAPFAISSLDCVFVPINPLLTPAQVEHIVMDCDIRVVITSPDRLARLEKIVDKYSLTILLTKNIEVGRAFNAAVKIWSPQEMPLAISSEARELPLKNAKNPRTTLAALLYTSGSTGTPKGVMVSHENLLLGALSVNQYLNIGQQDRLLAALPFSFDYGLNQLISSVIAGAHCVLFDYLFPQDIAKAVALHNITGIAGVPTLWSQIAELKWPDDASDSVRYITNSGGHLPETVLRKLQKIFKRASPFLMYGLTEAFRSTYLPPEEINRRPNSIGRAIPNSEILVITDEQELAAVESEGELVHCGPLVTMGYWRRPEETAKVFRCLPSSLARRLGLPPDERVAWSGDTVKKDREGYLYFVGRRDAMIKTSGYRVSAEEIEEVIFAHESVQAAAAVGVKDVELGQAIVVCVVLNEDGLEHDQSSIRGNLKAHCRSHLPSYLVPKEIYIYEQLPKNPNGKIDRKQLAMTIEASQES